MHLVRGRRIGNRNNSLAVSVGNWWTAAKSTPWGDTQGNVPKSGKPEGVLVGHRTDTLQNSCAQVFPERVAFDYKKTSQGVTVLYRPECCKKLTPGTGLIGIKAKGLVQWSILCKSEIPSFSNNFTDFKVYFSNHYNFCVYG